MATCTKCKRRDAMEQDALCKGCFCRIVEEKVQKGIRMAGVMKQGGIVQDDGSAAAAILKKIISKAARAPQGTARISTRTLDELNAGFFENILKISEKKDETDIFPMQEVTTQECERYCTLKGIAFAKRDQSGMEAFIAGFEERRPGVHHSIARSRKHVNEKNSASDNDFSRPAKHTGPGNN